MLIGDPLGEGAENSFLRMRGNSPFLPLLSRKFPPNPRSGGGVYGGYRGIREE